MMSPSFVAEVTVGLYAVSMATDMQDHHGYAARVMFNPPLLHSKCISADVFIRRALTLPH